MTQPYTLHDRLRDGTTCTGCEEGAVSEPQSPENVRALMTDGREIPLECRYVGEFDGVHRWEAVYSLAERPRQIAVGALPPKTAVSVLW